MVRVLNLSQTSIQGLRILTDCKNSTSLHTYDRISDYLIHEDNKNSVYLEFMTMLSIEQCKIYFTEYNLSDKQVEAIRDGLYMAIATLVDERFSSLDNKIGINLSEKEEKTTIR